MSEIFDEGELEQPARQYSLAPAMNPFELIDSYTKAYNSSRPARRHTAFHGSRAGGCFRQSILERSGATPEPTSGKSRYTFLQGDMMEKVVFPAIHHSGREHGYHALEQLSVGFPDGFATGHADILLEFYGGKYALWDCKSCQGKSFTYKKRDREKGVVGDSEEKNRLQVGTYAWWMSEGWWLPESEWLFGGDKKVKPDECGVFYAAKEVYLFDLDTFDVDEYIEKAKIWWGKLREYWKAYLEPAADSPLPPEVPLVKGKPHWGCNYCAYYMGCPNVAKVRQESEE